MALINTGYLEYEELSQIQKLPSDERYAKGPVAVIECVQEIPCNPCEAACRFGAIHIGDPITNLPTCSHDKCTGCGVCVSKCPGLAIFIVNKACFVNDDTDSESEEVIELTHPASITLSKIIVNSHDMDAATGKCVQINR